MKQINPEGAFAKAYVLIAKTGTMEGISPEETAELNAYATRVAMLGKELLAQYSPDDQTDKFKIADNPLFVLLELVTASFMRLATSIDPNVTTQAHGILCLMLGVLIDEGIIILPSE